MYPVILMFVGGLSLFDELPVALRRLLEATEVAPWLREATVMRRGYVVIFLHNLSPSPDPNPNSKIETLHGCAEGIADSL